MRSAIALVLLPFFKPSHSEDALDALLDKLIYRAPKSVYSFGTDFDNVTSGKSAHAATPTATNLAAVPIRTNLRPQSVRSLSIGREDTTRRGHMQGAGMLSSSLPLSRTLTIPRDGQGSDSYRESLGSIASNAHHHPLLRLSRRFPLLRKLIIPRDGKRDGKGFFASNKPPSVMANSNTAPAKEELKKEMDAEEATKKYGLEAGLWKAFTNKGESTVKPGDLLKRYGAAYLATSISLSIISYATCYFLISNGVDVALLLGKIGIQATASASTAGTAAIAYAVHKAASPVRFPPTVALTPVVAGWLGK